MTTTDRHLDDPWRERLSRRLAVTAAVVAPGLTVALVVGTESTRIRVITVATGLALTAALAWLARPKAPAGQRAIMVICTFALIGFVGYATLGFLSAPGVAFASAVTFSGLLLGRRAMIWTILVTAVAMSLIGTLMVHDIIAAPPLADISPERVRPWVRSTGLTTLLIALMGAGVTLVVESIEATVDRVESEGRRRREAERQVQHAQSTELIGQLAASLAHDVNNHLTVIAAWNDLGASLSTGKQRERARRAIAHSTEQASSLTTQLLMLGRRDAPAPEAVDLARFLAANEQMVRTVAPDDTEVSFTAEDDVWCWIDRSQLGQVLLNLTVNARDAMPSGGQLTVAAGSRCQTRGTGVSGPIPTGDWVVLTVQDTGVGMDAETARRAFEPFYTTKRVGEGTGLGLATVKAIVDRAEGHIVLRTAEGSGTTLEVWLPAGSPGAEPELPVAVDAESPLGPIRVLLAEDSAGVLEVARHALEAAGATVVAAGDGDEALACLAAGPFDVLCADVVMPGISVAALIDAFRAANPSSPVLLCSGYVGEELVRHGVEEGRFSLLPKPYTPALLVDAVRKVLGTRR